MVNTPTATVAGWPRFGQEFLDFLRFVVRPDFARLPGRRAQDGWREDWFPRMRLGRLFQWAGLLWLINLVVLGPIAVAAAGLGGAEHRLRLDNIPWLQAVLWAPLVEELVFRYGLRRLGQLWWLLPASLCALLIGPSALTMALVALILFACWWPQLQQRPSDHAQVAVRFRLRYRKLFFWVLHLSCLAFAAIHLGNFSYTSTPLWVLPLLVLPQWLTGLVLAWIRVRRGFGAAVALHGIFNAGPLLIVWLVLSSVSGLPS